MHLKGGLRARAQVHSLTPEVREAKALIASADIDGFRIDPPMQVDLGFFKAWVPAVKDYAASLGKANL